MAESASINVGGPAPTRGEEAASWVGLLLMLGALMIRALSPLATLPYWDLDPLVAPAAASGLGPAGSMIVDACVMLGAGLLLFGTARLGRPRGLAVALLLLAPAFIVIAYHGWFSAGSTLGQQRTGMAWVSAGLAALAIGRAGRDPRFRAVAFAGVLGVITAMSVKALGQVLVENPQTIADFQLDRDKIFAMQGWLSDSVMARNYERRVMQNVATTWFGLSNVYATFAAAGAAGFAALVWTAVKSRANGWAIAAAGAGLGLTTLGVILTQSKGGILALLLGLGLVALSGWCRHADRSRSSPWLPWLGPALVVGTWCLVVARGLVGDRIGELSLLFRWFYAQAATRIGLTNPVAGVGPEGFKDAYLLAKNPLSTEDVASPHLVALDWWACLGIAGLVLTAGLLWICTKASRGLVDSGESPHEFATRSMVRALVLLAAIVTLVCLALEQGVQTPFTAAMRMVGMMAWIGAGTAVLVIVQVDRSGRWVAGAAALAIVAAVHAQIDVTGSMTQSVGLWAVCLGLGATGPWFGSAATGHPRGAALQKVLGGVLVALAAGFAAVAIPPVLHWESSLARAAEAVRPVAEVRAILAGEDRPRDSAQQRAQRAAERLSTELGKAIRPEEAGWANKELERIRSAAAYELLKSSGSSRLRDFPTAREASRLAISLALDAARRGDRPAAESWRDRAEQVIADSPGRFERASELSWRATLDEAWFGMTRDPNDGRAALEGLERAIVRSPYNLTAAWRALVLAVRLNDPDRVVRLATTVARLDDQTRYDRAAAGLGERERAWVDSLLKVPPGGAWPDIPGP